jgi:uncharacterized phage protein (TIGR01671 family)
MREIKFRAWDKTGRRFLNGFYLNVGRCVDKTEIGVWNHEESEIIFAEYPQLELSEYTGLKDKNSKEIYEGDVIKYTKNKHLVYPNFVAEVIWYKYSWGVKIQNSLNVYDPFCIHDEIETDFIPYIEIIGNKWENPELLGEKRNA